MGSAQDSGEEAEPKLPGPEPTDCPQPSADLDPHCTESFLLQCCALETLLPWPAKPLVCRLPEPVQPQALLQWEEAYLCALRAGLAKVTKPSELSHQMAPR